MNLLFCFFSIWIYQTLHKAQTKTIKNEFMRERVWSPIEVCFLCGGELPKPTKTKNTKNTNNRKDKNKKTKPLKNRLGPDVPDNPLFLLFFCFSSRFLWFLAILVADESFRIQNSKQLLKRNQSLWRKSGPGPRESFWFSFFFPHLCGTVWCSLAFESQRNEV